MDVVRRRIDEPAIGGFSQRVPPHNLEAEMSVLGAMLLSAEAVEIALKDLKPEDFSRAGHATIFESVGHLANRGEPVDAITVADRLESTGELERIGGKPYLLDITNTVPTAANVRYYAEIVKRTSTLRRLIRAGTHVAQLGYEAPDDLDAVVEQAEKAVFDVTQARIESNFAELRVLMKDSLADLKCAVRAQGAPHRACRPGSATWTRSCGASSRATSSSSPRGPRWARRPSRSTSRSTPPRMGHPVALFSLEMSAPQLTHAHAVLRGPGQLLQDALRAPRRRRTGRAS